MVMLQDRQVPISKWWTARGWIIPAVLVTSFLWMIVVACDEQDPHIEATFTMPTMSIIPVKLEIDPVAVGEEIALGDLIIGIPEGWIVDSPPTEEDDTWQVPITALDGSGQTSIKFVYGKEPSMLDNLAPGLTKRIQRYVSDYDEFLDQFATDLDFIAAIHEVVPGDLRRSSGDAETIKALLSLKISTPNLTKRIDSSSIHAFIGFLPMGRFVGGKIIDSRGTYRGIVNLWPPESFDGYEAELLLAKLLINAKFTDKIDRPGSMAESSEASE